MNFPDNTYAVPCIYPKIIKQQELKDTSVVMTKFDIGDGMHGMIGVVGPTRMDYAKVTARLSYFAESLSKMFAKPEQPQLPEAEDKE